MSEICNYCEVDFDYHDHSHLACECLPKQIQLLEANLAACREEYENLKEGFRKLNTDSMAYVDRTTDQLSAYKEALEKANKILIPAKDDTCLQMVGCDQCGPCIIRKALKALTPVQSPDAREKA